MQEPYQPRKTASLITALGAIILLAGLAAIILGVFKLINPRPTNIPGITLIIVGASSVIAASLLYIIGNLSEDVHRLTYDVEYLTSQN